MKCDHCYPPAPELRHDQVDVCDTCGRAGFDSVICQRTRCVLNHIESEQHRKALWNLARRR